MNQLGKLVILATLLLLPAGSYPSAASEDEGWVSLFDGKTLSGWTKGGGNENSKWEVVDGVIVGSGSASMLYSPKGDYKNFHFKAEVKINDHGNSGMYFRSPTNGGNFSDGYEAQIDSTHRDPIRTGSIYGSCTSTSSLFRPTPGLPTRSSAWTELARAQRASYQGMGQRRASVSVHRADQGLGEGLFRLPAARSR